jgi:molybdopterin-guanine dinucleotide biosynthesis protein A
MTPAGAASLVLCGGRASRMGAPKESVTLRDGCSMIQWVCRTLEPLGLPILLATGTEPSPFLLRTGLPVIPDRSPFEGPLSAIGNALRCSDRDGLLVVCCDQPLLDPRSLRELLPGEFGDARPAHFVSGDGRDLGPFPGYFPALCLSSIQAALASGERSPRRWLSSQERRQVRLDPTLVDTIISLDSPDAIRFAGLAADNRPCAGTIPFLPAWSGRHVDQAPLTPVSAGYGERLLGASRPLQGRVGTDTLEAPTRRRGCTSTARAEAAAGAAVRSSSVAHLPLGPVGRASA